MGQYIVLPSPIVPITDSTGQQITAVGGALQTANTGSFVATYSAATLNLTPATLATDVLTLFGSATKAIKILRIGISGVQTNAGQVTAQLIKRSATNTGGTSSAPTPTPHDSADAVATATVKAYTANPTALGTAVGTIRTARLGLPSVTSATSSSFIEWTFGDIPEKSIILRGIAEGIAINLGGVTLTGGSLDVYITWAEV